MRGHETLTPFHDVLYNPTNALQNMVQIDRIVFIHKGTASHSTRSRRYGLRAFSVTISTLCPNISSSSSTKPAGNQELVVGPFSMSRSMSLSALASPRTTEPKTRIL